jgi:hypothetical protein
VKWNNLIKECSSFEIDENQDENLLSNSLDEEIESMRHGLLERFKPYSDFYENLDSINSNPHLRTLFKHKKAEVELYLSYSF